MALVGDMVVQTANAPGAGSFNLIAPSAGRSSFVSSAGAGQVFYFAEDSSSWEKGVGTVVSGSPDTLSRDIVLGNSLGTTAKINFAGAVTIICDIPAERSIWANAGGDALLAANRRLAGLAAGSDVADAIRRDQLAWEFVGSEINLSGLGGVLLPLPPGYRDFKVELNNVGLSGSTFLYMRCSVDGSTVDSSTLYARATRFETTNNGTGSIGGVSNSDGASNLFYLSGTISSSQNIRGSVQFDGKKGFINICLTDTLATSSHAGAIYYSGAYAVALFIAPYVGNFSYGSLRLTGMRGSST